MNAGSPNKAAQTGTPCQSLSLGRGPDDEMERGKRKASEGRQSTDRIDCLNEGRGKVCVRMEMEEVSENDDEVSAVNRRE